jgi:hypothetical protein
MVIDCGASSVGLPLLYLSTVMVVLLSSMYV